jgi:hypothetical protein
MTVVVPAPVPADSLVLCGRGNLRAAARKGGCGPRVKPTEPTSLRKSQMSGATDPIWKTATRP